MKMVATAPSTRGKTALKPLRLIDLYNDFEELVELLRTELARGSWLDAYLLAAGISQVAEDYLESDRALLVKASAQLASSGGVGGRVASRGLRAVESTRRWVRRLWGADERVEVWLRALAPLMRALATTVVGDETNTGVTEIAAGSRALFESYIQLPTRLRRSVLRLPSCFRSFDQHPDDMSKFANLVVEEGLDRAAPIAVVGVRTSGSYLAPLVAAALEMRGFADVSSLTVRPGSRLSAAQRKTLRRVSERGGIAAVVDDPPTTGGSLRKAADALVAAGVRADSIVLLVALSAGMAATPESLRGLRTLALPWEQWSIHERLTVTRVGATLVELLGPRQRLLAIWRVGTEHQTRGHASARFRVTLADAAGGSTNQLDIRAGGAGIGYFGEHSVAVAKQLGSFSPRVIGVADGVVFREWLPGDRRIDATDDGMTKAVVEYVVTRSRALSVPADQARRLRGRLPVWEAASNLLSQAFGRGWAWARIPVVDPLVARCLRVDAPAVVDGSMGTGNWFRLPRGRRLVKVDSDRRAFANLDLASYDPVYDLASFAADTDSDAARAQFEMLTGAQISPERWFLLQAVHLWDRLRLGDGDEPWLRRAMSRTAQRYFAQVYLGDVIPSAEGPLVALDVDGVLESESVGMSAMTMSSALALRALHRHGFRPVLMTGRSLPEVIDRCRTLHFAGGVAEYGSVVYDHGDGSAASLLSARQQDAVEWSRAAVARLAGVTEDVSYRYSVRAFRPNSNGRRRAPDLGAVTQALHRAGIDTSIDAIPGDSQIDLVAPGVSKGAGLAQLATKLGARPGGIALVVGDGPRDASAFGLARLSFAPKHASSSVRRAASHVAHGRYQAGLADAVAALIGHRPGACPTCRVEPMPADRLDLLRLLSAQEQGIASMAAQGSRLLLSAYRKRRTGRAE